MNAETVWITVSDRQNKIKPEFCVKIGYQLSNTIDADSSILYD